MQHFHLDKVTYKRLKKERTKIDKTMIVAGILIQFATVAQIVEIFRNQDSGSVSLASWVSYALFSLVALLYGFAHGLRPLLITNSLGLTVNSLVVVGILMY